MQNNHGDDTRADTSSAEGVQRGAAPPPAGRRQPPGGERSRGLSRRALGDINRRAPSWGVDRNPVCVYPGAAAPPVPGLQSPSPQVPRS